MLLRAHMTNAPAARFLKTMCWFIQNIYVLLYEFRTIVIVILKTNQEIPFKCDLRDSVHLCPLSKKVKLKVIRS